MKERILRGRLPACILTTGFMQQLWAIINQDGEPVWQAVVGSNGDLVTTDDKDEARPIQTVRDWSELVNLLGLVPRIDRLHISVEIAGKGEIAVFYKNFNKATGSLVVTGSDEAWVEETHVRITDLFIEFANPFVNRLFSTLGYIAIHSAIPLSAAFVIVVVVLSLLIPGEYRRSELIYWISTISILITLWLASILSDRLIIYTLKKYPYIRWGR